MRITKLSILLILALTIMLSGCLNDSNTSQEGSNLIDLTSIQQLDEALLSGPAIVMIGYDTCPSCIVMKPVMENVFMEYEDVASVMYLNTRNTPALASQFGVGYVPDSFVIVDKVEGEYVYMRYDGTAITERNNARFVGVVKEETVKNTLDYAIAAREQE
ncbi:thioredoxin family protein [Methanolobus sp. ZRKC3]|uniref:thioredoxin family protein n=1 Tax=Methanolobus sp. ZRKC3 TaxID=3125786 RepID=UPI003249EA95